MNMLGVGNAATPFGLKAMKELQQINKTRESGCKAHTLSVVFQKKQGTAAASFFMNNGQYGVMNNTHIYIF